ncbi:MAG: hypothetical protein KC493_06660 [Bacteriovoracaceae bacterium]|nr:hypothetical protein [Bacteriovoracaceae bacterium]
MKVILGLLFIFASFKAQAGMIGFGFGSITTHYTTVDKNVHYCRNIKDTGVILNQNHFIRFGFGNDAIAFLKGKDSICSPIFGAVYSRYITGSKNWDLNFLFGGYEFRKRNWDRYAETVPNGRIPPEPVYMRFGGTTIVPVVAIALTFRIWGNLWLNNAIAPIITNHSFEYRIYF